MTRKKELHVYSKATQNVQSVEQVKNVDGLNAARTQNMFISTVLGKIVEMRLKFSQGSITLLKIIGKISTSKSWTTK